MCSLSISIRRDPSAQGDRLDVEPSKNGAERVAPRHHPECGAAFYLAAAAHSLVSVFGQIQEQLQERRGLTDEESVCREGIQGSHRRPGRLGRSNDRARRELPTEERRGLGHDQVGLEILAT